MGMSTHVAGFKPPDEMWRRMKAVWDACEAANLTVPTAVKRFFEGEAPDDEGVEVDQYVLIEAGAVRKWIDDAAEGFEIVVANIPPDVKVIRVYNAW